jgi:anti-sigma factor RsiW
MNNNHLNHQQLCDLLIDSTPDAASSAHLASCPACSAEFSTLETSLGLFRQASIQLAERSIERRPLLMPERRTRRFLTVPAYVAAAALLAVAILVPMRSGDSPTPTAQTPGSAAVETPTNYAAAESDEALFEEINSTIASSVPAPMQPLANPTGIQGSTR